MILSILEVVKLNRFSSVTVIWSGKSFDQWLSLSFCSGASCFQAHYDLTINVALQWLDHSEDFAWLEGQEL